MSDIEPRYINPPFMLGLIALPIVFVWFLLLPGYARSTRIAAFTYAFAIPALSLVAWLLLYLLDSLFILLES
jgi:hypothetical protein